MTPFAKIAVYTLLAITLGGLAFFIVPLFGGGKQLPILGNPGHQVQDFSFLNQNGKTVTQNNIAGKIVIAEYFFTTCPGICKDMSANLKKVYNKYHDDTDVVILSHTVDPETDSVPVLKAYAEKYGVQNENWQFLTGDKYQLYKLAHQSYLLTADSARRESVSEAFIHTQYVCLVDKKKRIRGFYDATSKESTEKLIEDIKRLSREG